MPARLPMVSVLIPAHNEESHIAAAIESALYQKTRFPVEILVIDDGSTDGTAGIVEAYAARHGSLRLLRNETRQGKGHSIRRAYNDSRGMFVHVLDADDIFSSWDKLQKQVDVLMKRTDCFAVAHNTLFFAPDDRVKIVPGCAVDTVYSYADCYRNRFYCHTSSYLFRRLPAGLPEYFERQTMRGDTALFFFHAFSARKSVYVLRDVMSVYDIHGQGIWSGLDEKARADMNVSILRDLQDLVVRDRSLPEYNSLQTRIDWTESRSLVVAKAQPPAYADFRSLDVVIRDGERTAARIFRPEVRAPAFQAMYSLPAVDILMETIGRALLTAERFTFDARRHDAGKVVLLVSGFVPNGGGVFREIKEIVAELLRRGTRIDILCSGKIDTAPEIIEAHFTDPLITVTQLDRAQPASAQIREGLRFLIASAPDRIYPFLTHHDVVGTALLQRGLGRQIVLDYVYDHGSSLGVHNSAIDRIVVKTQTQASALAPVIDAARIGLLAPFFTDKFDRNPYVPLRTGVLTTASAAARSYKVESDYHYAYFDVLFAALCAVDMRHVHYGPLSAEALDGFLARLRDAGVDPDRFVHIPWADDLGRSLLDTGVDMFIAPFPVCSARIGIEVMCCGIPSLNHRSILPGLPEAGDFADPDQPQWATPADLVATLGAMDAARLRELSASARAFFCANNDSSVALRRFVDGDFAEPVIDPYPRFLLNDLAREAFFDDRSAQQDVDACAQGKATQPQGPGQADGVDQPAQARPARPKFWLRTPARRRMRALFHRLRKA